MKLVQTVLMAALAVSAPAFAADGTASVQSQTGLVQASSGGDFAPTQVGQVLNAGDRLMLGEDSRAALVYSTDCQVIYSSPGVYTVSDECKPGAVPIARDGVSVAKVAAGVGIGAAILATSGGDDDDPPSPPVSR